MARVEVATALGAFTLAIDEAAAPISAASFLAYVDGGHLRDAAIYRIVAAGNQGAEVAHKMTSCNGAGSRRMRATRRRWRRSPMSRPA